MSTSQESNLGFSFLNMLERQKTVQRQQQRQDPRQRSKAKIWKTFFFPNSNLTTPGRAGIEFEVALFDIESILVKKLLKSILNEKPKYNALLFDYGHYSAQCLTGK